MYGTNPTYIVGTYSAVQRVSTDRLDKLVTQVTSIRCDCVTVWELFEGGGNFLQLKRVLVCGVNSESRAGRNQGINNIDVMYTNVGIQNYDLVIKTFLDYRFYLSCDVTMTSLVYR